MKLQISKNYPDKFIYGSKAYWLSWLINKTYKVPRCFYLSLTTGMNEKVLFELFNSNKIFIEEIEKYRKNGFFKLAIRSSALDEDLFNQSKAGHYKSVLSNFENTTQILNSIFSVYQSINKKGTESNQIGIVIQEKIEADFSGVLFSSNPISYSKQEVIVSVVKGMGDKLVSGEVEGTDIVIQIQKNEFTIIDYDLDFPVSQLNKLCEIGKSVEKKLGFPVDIEWCIDKKGEIHLLQCRPVTGLNMQKSHKEIIPINLDNKDRLNNNLLENDKVKIRLLAEENNVDISNAYLVVCNEGGTINEKDLSNIVADSRCVGYSVVLLKPKQIQNSIVRAFSSEASVNQHSAYRTCRRYSHRSYGNNKNLLESLNEIRRKCGAVSWKCVIIIQEIFAPKWTGIIKKINNDIIVEVGKGHFIPKGVVPTSQYIIKDNQIVSKTEIIQPFWYDIVDGKVIKNEKEVKVTLNEKDIFFLIKNLTPMMKNKDKTLEFGLIETKDNLYPYLIDLADDDASELSSNLISSGVISTGENYGKLVSIYNTKQEESLELHLLNTYKSKDISDEKIIFLCNTPDIGLLELLKKYNVKNIGFIFKKGSFLSHFSIILREKGIPAIVYKDYEKIIDFDNIKIDALNECKSVDERIMKPKFAVTSYINPDSDGVLGCLVYSFYSQIHTPVIYGEIDKETKYILDFFNISIPNKNIDLADYDSVTIIDTHNANQLADEIPLNKVDLIIDHHPDGTNDLFPNAKIQNEKVGAACTLIAELIKEKGIVLDSIMASLLALAIYSNTLNLTAPSTSKRDRMILQWLSNYHGSLQDIIEGMFLARSDIQNISTLDILQRNIKKFQCNLIRFGIIQLESSKVDEFIKRKDFLIQMKNLRKENDLNYIFFSGVNFIEKKTTIVCIDERSKSIMSKIFQKIFQKDSITMDKILLRKTDFIPKLYDLFEQSQI